MHAQMMLVLAATWGLLAGTDDKLPTQTDFIREVFDAKPSPLTPKFHDAPEGYHVIKEDLAKGLVEEAQKRKADLRGILIAGPMSLDPLWTYTIVVFIQEGDKIRINLLVFPHARITYKSTSLVSNERYEKWVTDMQGTGALEAAPPAAAGGEKDQAKKDRMFTLLYSTSGAGGKDRRSYHANPEKLDGEKRERFENLVNGILENQKTTYTVYEDDEDKDS